MNNIYLCFGRSCIVLYFEINQQTSKALAIVESVNGLLLWHDIVGQHIRVYVGHILVMQWPWGRDLVLCVGDLGGVPWEGLGVQGGHHSWTGHWVHHH